MLPAAPKCRFLVAPDESEDVMRRRMMKATILAVAVGLATLAAVGCGDDTTETGGSGASGSSTTATTGSGGSGNAATSTTGAANGGGGAGMGGMGMGGMGMGGMGMGGMGMGGSGDGSFGSPCTGAADCNDPYVCFTFGMGQMLCTKTCQNDADCAP